ncbi:MAG: N-6 DNA methylase [Blastocatellia bacterium]|nr:N-6 DNA methylase [Blastocatellia bacterium]
MANARCFSRWSRAAVIVPEGLLFNSSKAHVELRRQLLFENNLEAVISLPGNISALYRCKNFNFNISKNRS